MGFPKAMYQAGVPPTEQDSVAVLNEGEETLLRSRGFLDGHEYFARINAAEASKTAPQQAAAAKAKEKEQAAREKAAEQAAKQKAAAEAAQKQEEAQKAAVIRRQHLEGSIDASLKAPLQRRLVELGDRKRSLERDLAHAGNRDTAGILEKLAAVGAEMTALQQKLTCV